jgi:hypothetical protein
MREGKCDFIRTTITAQMAISEERFRQQRRREWSNSKEESKATNEKRDSHPFRQPSKPKKSTVTTRKCFEQLKTMKREKKKKKRHCSHARAAARIETLDHGR